MPAIKIPTNFNIDLEFEIPEFYRRLIALLIDMLFEFFYLRLAFEILSHSGEHGEGIDVWATYLIIWLPVFIYHPLMEITMNGQSVGKKIMGIRVVNETGSRPSISQFLIRWLLRLSDLWLAAVIIFVIADPSFGHDVGGTLVGLAALGFLITDVILVVSSKKGQRIGDILAKTILISVRSRGNIEETVFEEVADSYVPSFPQIMQLSDRDINAIKSILGTARRKMDVNMAEAAANRIKNHLHIDTQLSPFDFLDVLLKDYNYLSTK